MKNEIDLSGYDLNQLFKARDCLEMLQGMGFMPCGLHGDEETLLAVRREIEKRRVTNG